MRRFASLVLLLAATSVPGRATPARCADPCTVVTTSAGYVTPATEIASGQSVRWTTTESSHPTSDSPDDDWCFRVAVGAVTQALPVRFDVTSGGVTATNDGLESPTRPCRGATELPDGSYLLTFRCLLHAWMNGALIVAPPA